MSQVTIYLDDDALQAVKAAAARAAEIIAAAQAQAWAPMAHQGVLHDRASYRYFWQVLERAHRTGRALPNEVQSFFATNLH